ncbi:hypothetical protein [Actinomadura sp. NTSP31]|uniref:hypothetical protein n=1 Tax=Actinomadura sp. NTSP31 TaxID=1735447 RepID=UPI0035BF7DC8
MTPEEIDADLRAAVNDRLADRLEANRTRRDGRITRLTELHQRRTHGLRQRHAAKLARTQATTNPGEAGPPHATTPPTTPGSPVDTDAALRRAIADLTERERATLRQQSQNAAGRWTATLPRVGAVWAAFAAVVAEIDRAERARVAARQASRDQMHPGL